jgi:hypothetical protein
VQAWPDERDMLTGDTAEIGSPSSLELFGRAQRIFNLAHFFGCLPW